MITLEEIKNRLKERDASLVVAYKDGNIKEYYNERIIDLKAILKQDEKALQGSMIADKVVGKVAASIMAVAGVKELYAKTLSQMAIPILENANIQYSYDQIVEYIKNQDKTGMCPMETKYQSELNSLRIYQEIMNK